MKLLRFILIFALLIPAFMSCKKISGTIVVFETDEVHFSPEGGSKTVRLIKGNFDHMGINQISGCDTDYPPYEGHGDNYLKSGWIELTKIASDEILSLAITASPNTSGEARHAKLYFASLDRYSYIEVYQE